MLPGSINQKEFQGVVVPVLMGQRKRPADAPWKIPTEVVFYCGNSARSGKLLQKIQKDLKKVRVVGHAAGSTHRCHSLKTHELFLY